MTFQKLITNNKEGTKIMQVQNIVFFNDSKKLTKNPQASQQNYSKLSSSLTNDTVTFGASTPLKPNQVLPATEKLIERAIRQTKIEKNKILAALNKTWETFTMGKVSNIYIGHKPLPLDERQVEWLHQSIQLTGDIPGNKRVYFAETEPRHFLLHVDPIDNKIINPDYAVYDIDYRKCTDDNKIGTIEEFINNNMSRETTQPKEIKELNQRLQYYLKALFPKKTAK